LYLPGVSLAPFAAKDVLATGGAARPVLHVSVVTTPSRPQHEQFLNGCLESLFATTKDAPFAVRVTVVDNAPGNGIGARVKTRFPAVSVITNTERRGFAANHNAALRGSDADFFLVANDDLVFLPGSLERAVAYLEAPENARVAVIGFRLLNPDGTLQPSTYSFPSVHRAWLEQAGLRQFVPNAAWTRWLARRLARGGGKSTLWAHDRTVPVDTFFGALVLLRGAAVREVGWMDEISVIGGEESDWNQRFWNAGWSVVFLHDAAVTHYGAQTVGGNQALRAEYLKGTLNFFWKHRSRVAYYAFAASTAAVLTLRAGGYVVLGRGDMARVMLRSVRTVFAWGK
jgi:hypothetical protein